MSTGFYDLLSLQGITFPHTNVSSEATVGFEAKDGRNTAYVHITEATFDTTAYLSLALGVSSKAITAAQAKYLPGVTAGESIYVYGELYADSLDGERDVALQIKFFNESGDAVGSETEVAVTDAAEWQEVIQRVTVPATATRVNFYLKANCDADETVQAWLANLKIVR